MNANPAVRANSLIVYFVVLVALCAAFVLGSRALGEHGAYLAQGYMLTPALAALVTRLFFHEARFGDANLRFGQLKHYAGFWVASIAITALSYVFFTLLGAVAWDFSGNAFLDRLSQQFAAAGQDIGDTLPPGMTPHMMLLVFLVGGLTVFNVMPGIITGFGEEFGHRGLMFPALYRIRPWVAFVVGGLIWYAWHWPVAWMVPQSVGLPLWQAVLNFVVLGIGSLCTFTYLAYAYVKSRSVWVASIAHIVMNNSAASFSYLAILQNQVLANVGLALSMVVVVAVLYWTGELRVFKDYFQPAAA